MKICVFTFRNNTFDYFEEFPLNLLHEFEEISGNQGDRLIVIVMHYGSNFSGVNADVFRENRAVGAADMAHKSNFLHPVLYYFPSIPTGSDQILSFYQT